MKTKIKISVECLQNHNHALRTVLSYRRTVRSTELGMHEITIDWDTIAMTHSN